MFKTYSQFKRELTEGSLLRVFNRMKGYIEVREVVSVHTNHIKTRTEISEATYREYMECPMRRHYVSTENGRYYREVRISFEKAKHVVVDGIMIKYLAYEKEVMNNKVMIPSNDFKIGDVWLEIMILDLKGGQ